MEQKGGAPKRPIIFYYIIGLVIILLLNAFLVPTMFKPETVGYNVFLDDLKSGKVRQVEIQDTQIGVLIQEEEGKNKVYITGNMNDPELTDKLYDAGVEFGQGDPKAEFTASEFFAVLDSAAAADGWPGPAAHAADAEADGRGCHGLWPEQRQNLCQGADRQNLCGRGRTGRGQGGPDRDCGLSAQPCQI